MAMSNNEVLRLFNLWIDPTRAKTLQDSDEELTQKRNNISVTFSQSLGHGKAGRNEAWLQVYNTLLRERDAWTKEDDRSGIFNGAGSS